MWSGLFVLRFPDQNQTHQAKQLVRGNRDQRGADRNKCLSGHSLPTGDGPRRGGDPPPGGNSAQSGVPVPTASVGHTAVAVPVNFRRVVLRVYFRFKARCANTSYSSAIRSIVAFA